jgi:hypothetical protein
MRPVPGTAYPSGSTSNNDRAVEVDELATQVEDAADCFSWGPDILRRWLAMSSLPSPTIEALMALADGMCPTEAFSSVVPPAGTLTREIVQIVSEGPTPNQIRARLKAASELEAGASQAA